MKPSLLILATCAWTLNACSQGTQVISSEGVSTNAQSVVDGVKSPDLLPFPIGRYQRNAVVAQVVQGSQGCTGTVVGDKLVVTASHCVVTNQSAWLSGGASPQVAPASMLTYAVGDDIHAPLCTLQAKEIHLHPQAGPDAATGAIRHDMALIVLDKSVIDSCPQLVPVQMNRTALTSETVGQLLLQGGFGSLDHTYKFSPIRYWSVQQVSAVKPDYFAFRVFKGGPSFGDSGSGFLRHFADGSVRSVGIDSLAFGLLGTAIRLDAQGAFIDQIATTDRLCGAVSSSGMCRGNAAVSCGPQGFVSDDCEQSGKTCVMDGGKAICGCSCDTSPGCDAGCACDPSCSDAGVDGGADAGELDAGPPPPTGTCTSLATLTDKNACGAGFTCDLADFVDLSAGCRPDGPLEAYKTCSVSSERCQAGSTCLALKQDNWTCSPFCKDMMKHSTCPGRGVCLPVFPPVGNCVAPDDCDLVGSKGCGYGEVCYPIVDGTFCLPGGAVKEGGACSSLNDCASGLGCVNDKCTRWCKSNADCSGSSCTDIGSLDAQKDVGVCSGGPVDAGADVVTPSDAGQDAAEAGTDAAQGHDSGDLSDAAQPDAQTQDAAAEDDTGEELADGGCSCRTAPSPSKGSLPFMALLMGMFGLAYRRRRRGCE